MDYLQELLDNLKFSEVEFKECKKKIEELFKDEIQSHKTKQFIGVRLTNNDSEINVFTNKFSVSINKTILNDEYVLKSNIKMFNMSKNSIQKNNDRVRWILETVDKVIKTHNSLKIKIERFIELYGDKILKEFIDNLEHKFNLNIVNKKATEFLNSQLYEETESLFNTETDDYEEAHNIAMYNLQSNSEILEALLKYSDNKLEIR